MAKYNKRIVMHITGLVSSDSYTITEICELVGISESTFHEWKKTKAEFSDALKKASEKFDESCVSEAKKSLIKMARGYDVTETKTVYSNIDNTPIVKEQTETTKHIQPSLGAAIFILTNKDPDNWKNRQNTDNNVNLTGSIPVEEWIKERIK
jgi:predicted DNA-binding transcriptional regulator AlpA